MNVERLKREAKQIKRAEGCTHVAALDRVAVREGFANWSLLMRTHNRTQPVSPVDDTHTIP